MLVCRRAFAVLYHGDNRRKSNLVRAGRLAAFDAVIVPGGSGSKQAERLGRVGRENIRKFVREGKGYVGICAGAYLASSSYSWSLNLLNAKVVDSAHWARGTGEVDLNSRRVESCWGIVS